MKTRVVIAVSIAALLAGGCVPNQTAVNGAPSAAASQPNVLPAKATVTGLRVNDGYKAGSVEIPVKEVPTLEDVINRVPPPPSAAEDEEDRLRAPAMKDAALSYGARAGLAFASRNINEMLGGKADELSKIYDFAPTLITGPDGVSILPPVISESRETWESFEAGKALRVADTVYEIIQQARFTPVSPLWHSYLIRNYSTPDAPPDALLPRNDGERDAWRKWVTEGWMMGLSQADEIFKADLHRLERDLTGMLRYKALLEENKVTPPVVAEGRLGVTGTGDDMRVNDRAIRIARDPKLQTDSTKWSATATTPGASAPAAAPYVPTALPPQPQPKPAAPAPAKSAPSTSRRY